MPVLSPRGAVYIGRVAEVSKAEVSHATRSVPCHAKDDEKWKVEQEGHDHHGVLYEDKDEAVRQAKELALAGEMNASSLRSPASNAA
jgi:Uncharacterized protein conserved in bacteria (DUF2188)